MGRSSPGEVLEEADESLVVAMVFSEPSSRRLRQFRTRRTPQRRTKNTFLHDSRHFKLLSGRDRRSTAFTGQSPMGTYTYHYHLYEMSESGLMAVGTGCLSSFRATRYPGGTLCGQRPIRFVAAVVMFELGVLIGLELTIQ